MPANRPRHAQKLPLIYIIVGMAIFGCAAGFGIKLLNVKLRIVQDGQRLKRIDKELASLTKKNEGLATQREQLTSQPALAKAIKGGFVKVVPIDEKFVIQVGAPKHRVAAVDFQPAKGGAR
jgi:cell division protein FtsB